MKGRLFGVGVGPGDPELMTYKAVRTIEKCPVIAVPAKGREHAVSYRIAAGMVDNMEEKEYLDLDTPMTKDRQILDMEPENRIENSTDGISHGNVYGTYIHGIFDKEKIVSEIVKSLAEKKGLSMEEVEGVDLKAFKESQYDLLADTLRKHLDMKAIYQIMGMQK